MQNITNNKEVSRYEQDINGLVIFADYKNEGGVLYITHVEAPQALRGTGAADKFMQALMGKIGEEGINNIVPLCSYAAAWMTKHHKQQEKVR